MKYPEISYRTIAQFQSYISGFRLYIQEQFMQNTLFFTIQKRTTASTKILLDDLLHDVG